MAGDLFFKEAASLVTLTTTGASLTDKSASALMALDGRSTGTVGAAENFMGVYEWLGQWATVTGIAANSLVGELYMVPRINTSSPDVDLTAGASVLPVHARVGSIITPKTPTAATNIRLVSNPVDLAPVLYDVYFKNVSGQTMTVNWALYLQTWRGQYS